MTLRLVTYLSSGGKVGDTIRAEVTCDKCTSPYLSLSPPPTPSDRLLPAVGKTLAYTSIKFTNVRDELVARGSHTKYVALAWKDPQNITDELSPRPEKGGGGGGE